MKIIIKPICLILAVVTLAMSMVTANAAPGDLFVSVGGGYGNGVGSIYQYTPDGVQSTFAFGLSSPRGLAFDSAGNLFVATTFADATRHATVLKIPPDGIQNVFGTIPNSRVAEGVANDRSGNVFVMTFIVTPYAIDRASIIYKFTPDEVRKPFEFLPNHPSQGFGLAFDSIGNLFAADSVASTIYSFAPDGTQSVFVGPEAFTGFGDPIGLALDSAGNLFVSTEGEPGNDIILEFTPNGTESTFATGLFNPRGLTFDAFGNLFVAESNAAPDGDILEFAPGGGAPTVFASGIDLPEFLAFGPAR
jgi:sugar lactone lactonase YvrE